MRTIGKKAVELLNSRNFLFGVLGLIILLGIFFRTYNFHDWLHFGNDQARDAMVVRDVLEGKTAWPLLGSPMGNTRFRLGPIYNYFQIIAAKIFGNSPEKLAYPDLLASIFSIPLLYLFLKRYFSKKLSYALTGLYALSYYSIEFARFAWNSNPMPFFVILFMLALLEFVTENEKTKWGWVFLVGISLGVGVQLHAILFLILSGTILLALVFSLQRSRKALSRWALVFLVAVLLNAPFIFSERKTNFADSKIFLASFTDKSDNGSSNFMRNLELNLACHAQANSLILSSLGNKENCDFLYAKARNVRPGSKLQLPVKKPLSMLGIFLSGALMASGYVLLLRAASREKAEKKKYFLWLVAVYATLSFLVMLPIIEQAPMRYFIQVIFVPFVLLGLVFDFMAKKYAQKYLLLTLATLSFFALSNIYSLLREARELSAHSRADAGYVVLDEVQPLVDFIVRQTKPQNEAYLSGGTQYYSPYNKPLIYLAGEQGLVLRRVADMEKIPAQTNVFYIWQSQDNNSTGKTKELDFSDHLDVGAIGIYKLNH